MFDWFDWISAGLGGLLGALIGWLRGRLKK
jgi:hypothetical protein